MKLKKGIPADPVGKITAKLIKSKKQANKKMFFLPTLDK